MEKGEFLTLPELELNPLGRPAHSQSLYRLRYPGSFLNGKDQYHVKISNIFGAFQNLDAEVILIELGKQLEKISKFQSKRT
jgi:hypothetical protein